jgi:hypothetical protein
MRRNVARSCRALSSMCTQRQTVHTVFTVLALTLIESVRTCTLPTMRFKHMSWHAGLVEFSVHAWCFGARRNLEATLRSSNGAVECGKQTTFKAMCTTCQLGEKVETHLYPNCAAFTRCWLVAVGAPSCSAADPSCQLFHVSCNGARKSSSTPASRLLECLRLQAIQVAIISRFQRPSCERQECSDQQP